ncbi:MAG TPA: DUF5684 domain-containing protein [Terriglobia bacterium]|nr:DUF5684 domain-containing protein [Terriglobia bacterium]
MKTRWRQNWIGLSSLVLAGVLASTSLALAQRDESRAAGALLAGAFLMVILVLVLVTYVYMAICLQTIAKKTNTPDGWLAWIPIANCILMLNIAHKPVWWIVLMLIPLVNIVIVIIVWMEIAKARGKPEWWGILMIVPILNLVAPGYLAFTD